MRFVRFVPLLGAFLALALASHISPAFARRVEECGIERYIYRQAEYCPVVRYILDRSPACGRQLCTGPDSCDAYKMCRHPSHGVELRTSCEKVKVWNDCAIRKTRVELDSYLEQMDRSLPSYGSLFLSGRALIAKQTSNANALACLVKDWDDDARYVDLVAQMKINYKLMTNQKYTDAACKEEVPQSISCAQDDVSEVCTAQRNIDAAREFLKANLDEATLLVGDVVPASEPAYRERLEALADDLARYLK